MSKEILRYTLLFICMLLVQVLICNHIALFNVAVPMVFIYFIIRLPMNIGNGILFTSAFVMGLCVDIAADTPGVNSLSATILSALKHPIFFAYVAKDDKTKDIVPSISSIGFGTYCKFLITLVAIFCFLVFSIEYFNFADIKEILIMTGASTLLSFLIMIAFDSFILSK